jgi:hypothetical protein
MPLGQMSIKLACKEVKREVSERYERVAVLSENRIDQVYHGYL